MNKITLSMLMLSVYAMHGASSYDEQRFKLFDAALHGHIDTVRELLGRGVDVNIVGCGKITPLHYAVYNGHMDIVRELIKSGANVNVRDYREETPLHYAVQRNKFEIAKILVELVDNTEKQNKDGKTPAELAQEYGYDAIATYIRDFKKRPQKELE